MPGLRRRPLHRAAGTSKAQHPRLLLLGFRANNVGDDYLALADQFDPEPLEPPDVGPNLCTIVYTGGTTGRPKGVLMTIACRRQ